jgi:hypothetical protein
MVSFEKPQKGNPQQLAINQHTFPAKSIARFADSSGRVQLQITADNFVRRAKPSDRIFCARRVWDHASEVGFCNGIEDNFQRLAERIIAGRVSNLNGEQRHIVSSFYALWLARVQIRERPEMDAVMPGIWLGQTFSKHQEEGLEKAGYAVPRGNVLPARIINGVALHVLVARHLRQIHPAAQWGIVQASSGEFLVPDSPLHHTFVPITPAIALASPAINQVLHRSAVGLMNAQLRSASRRYFFARDFTECP